MKEDEEEEGEERKKENKTTRGKLRDNKSEESTISKEGQVSH